jgi:hypothetical protein
MNDRSDVENALTVVRQSFGDCGLVISAMMELWHRADRLKPLLRNELVVLRTQLDRAIELLSDRESAP